MNQAELEASLRCEAKPGGHYVCRSRTAARKKAEEIIKESNNADHTA